ncbi:MAG: hypothetical protein LBD33_01570 [Puniceicoccales bacterium]|jgi:hypothetical protein|nr:hypothetical protein [Puniceicoccales bacterium]
MDKGGILNFRCRIAKWKPLFLAKWKLSFFAKDVTMIAMDLGNLGIKREDVTVEKLLEGTRAEYKKISSFGRFAIRWHEFFGNYEAARGIAQKIINDASLDDRSVEVLELEALDLETLLVGKINEKLVGDNKLANGKIVYNPPGCKPGLYEVKGGKLVEHGLKNGECVHNPAGCKKGTYLVEVNGSHGSLEKLGPNTVVANLHGVTGVHVTDADGNLQRKAEGDYVVVDGDTDFIGSDGKEKHLSAGAYKVVVDGQPPEEVKTPGTAFTVVDTRGGKRPYVVDDNGQPIELHFGDCVQISGDKGKGTDVNGERLKPGFFYEVNARGEFVPREKVDCIVVTGNIRGFNANGKRLEPGTYIVGKDGQPLEEVKTPGTVFTVDGAFGKRSYVVKDDGQPTWLHFGNFVQISRDGSTDFNGNPLEPGFYKVGTNGSFKRKNAGEHIITPWGAKVFNAKGEEKSLFAGEAYKVSDDGHPEIIEKPGTVFTVVDAIGKRSYVVNNNEKLIELKIGNFVQISGDGSTDVNGNPLEPGNYIVGDDGNFKRKDAGEHIVITKYTKAFKADGHPLDPGSYEVGADGKTLKKVQN